MKGNIKYAFLGKYKPHQMMTIVSKLLVAFLLCTNYMFI